MISTELKNLVYKCIDYLVSKGLTNCSSDNADNCHTWRICDEYSKNKFSAKEDYNAIDICVCSTHNSIEEAKSIYLNVVPWVRMGGGYSGCNAYHLKLGIKDSSKKIIRELDNLYQVYKNNVK